jgi:phosphomannomutase
MLISPIKNINFSPVKNINRRVNVFSSNLLPLKSDTVSFSGNYSLCNFYINKNVASTVAKSLSTSTSGHRAEYMGKTFTPDVVKLITLGMARYVKEQSYQNGKKPTVLIGGDTRRATRESLPLIRDTLVNQGINVIHLKDPVPSPLLAYAAEQYKPDLAVLMTASHNPWKDGGYNFVTKDGAIADAKITKQISENMMNIAEQGSYLEVEEGKGKVKELDPFDMYLKKIDSLNIDWNKIKNSGLKVYYDGLQGAGNYVFPKLLDKKGINYTQVKSEGQEGPNPIKENLTLLSENVVKNANNGLVVGLANDGDADRFGVIDEKGNFVSTNDVLLLTAYHLTKNKGLDGTIVRSQSTSDLLDKIAEEYNLPVCETPVGFKYLGKDILEARQNGGDILLAGEESGGLTIHGHIPEKDGILALSLIMELIATEKKPLSEILTDIKDEIGEYSKTETISVKYPTDNEKEAVMKQAEKLYNDVVEYGKTDFNGTHTVDEERTYNTRERMKTYKPDGDGFKFIMTDDSNILVRKSGTEPVVRFRVEAKGSTQEEAEENYNVIRQDLSDIFKI